MIETREQIAERDARQLLAERGIEVGLDMRSYAEIAEGLGLLSVAGSMTESTSPEETTL